MKASNIMPRTTVDIDAPILRELKRLGKEEGKSLGRLISDLLAEAIPRRNRPASPPPFIWESSAGDLLVDLLDKDAVYERLDGERFRKP
jgi:hypothetical protein